MNPFERKVRTRIRFQPQTWRWLLANPSEETLSTILDYNLLDSGMYLAPWISALIPLWEQQACDTNEPLAALLSHLEERRLSYIKEEDESLHSNLQRIRLLASTPGSFPFSPVYIQEHLTRYLEAAGELADLPELEVVFFSSQELSPLTDDLTNYQIKPHSRRYIQNLFHPERQEAILRVLAYVAKNHPLISTCRQAYALTLALHEVESWSQDQFCLRLLANRFWEYRVAGEI